MGFKDARDVVDSSRSQLECHRRRAPLCRKGVMQAARRASRFTRRTGFASGIGLALNFGNRSSGNIVNGFDRMVMGQVDDERVSYEKEHEPGHQPCPVTRRTWEFEPYHQAWESPVKSCYLGDGTTGAY